MRRGSTRISLAAVVLAALLTPALTAPVESQTRPTGGTGYWQLDQRGPLPSPSTWEVASSSARAEDTSGGSSNGSAKEKDFEVDVLIYAWIINTAGSIRNGGTEINMTATFIDYLRISDEFGIFMGKVEARYRRFGIYVDYVRATNGINIRTQAFNLAGVLTVPQLVGKFTVIQVFADVVAYYRLHDSKADGHSGLFGKKRVTVDLLGGIRYSRQSIKLAISANGLLQFKLGPIIIRRAFPDVNFSSTTERIDPIFGLRLGVQLNRRLHLTLRGDAGGFGVGSEVTWNAVAALRYKVRVWNFPVSILVGYRGLFQHTVDGEGAGEIVSKVTQHGPIIGLSVKF